MLLLALVLNIIAVARGVSSLLTIIFLIDYLIACNSNKDHDITKKKRRNTKILALLTMCLFIVEFLLGIFSNITWWPFLIAIIFAIIYVKCSDSNQQN